MEELQHQDAKAASAPVAAHAMKYQKNRLTYFVAFSSESRGGHVVGISESRRGHLVGKSSVTQIPLGRPCMQELDWAYPIS